MGNMKWKSISDGVLIHFVIGPKGPNTPLAAPKHIVHNPKYPKRFNVPFFFKVKKIRKKIA